MSHTEGGGPVLAQQCCGLDGRSGLRLVLVAVEVDGDLQPVGSHELRNSQAGWHIQGIIVSHTAM